MNDNDIFTTRLNVGLQGIDTDSSLRLELFFRGEKILLGNADLPFLIGRDEESCRLAVASGVASRNHCSIEVRNHQIGLFDRSTNGTFVKLGRADSIFVRAEFCPLIGQGYIRLSFAP